MLIFSLRDKRAIQCTQIQRDDFHKFIDVNLRWSIGYMNTVRRHRLFLWNMMLLNKNFNEKDARVNRALLLKRNQLGFAGRPLTLILTVSANKFVQFCGATHDQNKDHNHMWVLHQHWYPFWKWEICQSHPIPCHKSRLALSYSMTHDPQYFHNVRMWMYDCLVGRLWQAPIHS